MIYLPDCRVVFDFLGRFNFTLTVIIIVSVHCIYSSSSRYAYTKGRVITYIYLHGCGSCKFYILYRNKTLFSFLSIPVTTYLSRSYIFIYIYIIRVYCRVNMRYDMCVRTYIRAFLVLRPAHWYKP